MLIKLGIIIAAIVLGGMIFSNEIDILLPNTSATIVDSLKNDASGFSSKALGSVEQRIDDSIDQIIDNTSNSISSKINGVGDKISDKIPDTRELSQKMFNDKISNFDFIEHIQSIYK